MAFDPIWILTYYAPKYDRLDLSFLKNWHVIGKTITEKAQKMDIYES